jgi:hypothetical protein
MFVGCRARCVAFLHCIALRSCLAKVCAADCKTRVSVKVCAADCKTRVSRCQQWPAREGVAPLRGEALRGPERP